MHQCYQDIIERAGPPEWFDECAVPRYGLFNPSRVANVYAREAALVRIYCRNCGTLFRAAFSGPNASPVPSVPITELIAAGQLCYGDPPNTRCCAKGMFTGSVAEKVLEYWRKENARVGWVRDRTFEINLMPLMRRPHAGVIPANEACGPLVKTPPIGSTHFVR